MARPLRIDVQDGWYHTMSRGIERRVIFWDTRYYEHFLELLGEMSERYQVQVHAYALLPNHYHLILRTPQANCSQALQWLNVSYGAWFNAKRQRVGHVFQGRFRSTLIDEEGAWLLMASMYLHLNPVRITGLELGKRANRAESSGGTVPDKEKVRERLEVLRAYPWSSYRACAGYASAPPWLHTEELRRRAGGVHAYRRIVQAHVARGWDPSEFETLKEKVILGGAAFIVQAKAWVGSVSPEQPDRRQVARRVSFDQVKSVVENEKGEAWDDYSTRRGDWGRPLTLLLARQRCGLTLAEIGTLAGGLSYKTVGKSIERMAARLRQDRKLQQIHRRCLAQMSNVET
jgi:putative transposase